MIDIEAELPAGQQIDPLLKEELMELSPSASCFGQNDCGD